MKLASTSAALAAGLILSVAPQAQAQTAAGQTTPGGIVASGIAIANQPAIVQNSNAFKTAIGQIPGAYKAQIDQANTRKAQITAQLKPLYEKLDADSKAPNANRTALQQQYAQIQEIEQAGEREIQGLVEPINVAQQFVLEQIQDKLDQAMGQAMAKRKVTVVIDAQSVLKADQVYNLNQDVLTELNAIIPSAAIVPPAGWLPRAQREAQAKQAAAAAAQGGAAPAAPAAAAAKPGKKPVEGR
ncbi:OmpH family outer membrane protein [Novosphingobium sp. FKTRR1]|uniref:OmpH family outer membrane protein n=1 Tax=unclassified Novosphingobium TaxID=2644732 RepID=UPI001CF08650|nr:OmpH family outer membrane protein [Novosphingobium sp. FKTRR1]